MNTQRNLQKIATELLEAIGEDPTRTGLKQTPKRMAKMWMELFKGYDPNELPTVTAFPNNDDGIEYNQIIIDQGKFHSFCEHHMALFQGEYYFGYIPDRHIIGLSKIARVIDYFGARMQVQERLGNQIVKFINKKIEPRGLILVLKASHSCKSIRGVKKEGTMTTSILKGVFERDLGARQEFFNLLNLKNV